MTKKDWEEFKLAPEHEKQKLAKRLDNIFEEHKNKIQDDVFSKDFITYISDLIECERYWEADNEMDYLEDHLEDRFVKDRKRALG